MESDLSMDLAEQGGLPGLTRTVETPLLAYASSAVMLGSSLAGTGACPSSAVS